MNRELNAKLVNLMMESQPSNINLAAYLTETLHISKEAIYRRLRGDADFTLSEIAALASNLNFSLDQLVGIKERTGASLNMSLIKSPDSLSNYNKTLRTFYSILKILKKDPETTLYSATNMVPFFLYAKKEMITKFRFCRWLHQTNRLKGVHSLNEINLPPDMLTLHNEMAVNIRTIPKTIYIWDVSLFSTLVQEVKFFTKLKLVSKEDIKNIKKEVLDILDELESILLESSFSEGGKVDIYLCDLPVETTYVYIESSDTRISLLRIYGVNLIDTRHPGVCDIQKDWIHSLRRYSTLITHSNEMERLTFLAKQREYINSL